MSCKHLRELFDLCERNGLQFSSTDLIRIVCPQCGAEETCPSMPDDEYDKRHPGKDSQEPAADTQAE